MNSRLSQVTEPNVAMKPATRYDIDWLRILAMFSMQAVDNFGLPRGFDDTRIQPTIGTPEELLEAGEDVKTLQFLSKPGAINQPNQPNSSAIISRANAWPQ